MLPFGPSEVTFLMPITNGLCGMAKMVKHRDMPPGGATWPSPAPATRKMAAF